MLNFEHWTIYFDGTTRGMFLCCLLSGSSKLSHIYFLQSNETPVAISIHWQIKLSVERRHSGQRRSRNRNERSRGLNLSRFVKPRRIRETDLEEAAWNLPRKRPVSETSLELLRKKNQGRKWMRKFTNVWTKNTDDLGRCPWLRALTRAAPIPPRPPGSRGGCFFILQENVWIVLQRALQVRG